MAQNDFLPFAIATGSNVTPQDEYKELPAVSTGFVSGLADSMQINKAIRQGTVMASVLAQFIVDNTGNDVLDNGDTAPILALLNQAVGNISTAHIATATGSADEITATFSPAITLSNGMVVYVRATAANTTTAPTFNPDNLGALPIVKGANVALAAGDIGGAGYWMILQYDQAFNKWVLQNPAKGIDVSTGVPVGTVVMFTAAEPPAGYLKCDGSAVGRTTYPELYAAIGTTYGAGDGSTTFNLPDLIGRFAEGSATPGAVKEAGLPNITGEINGHFGSSVAFGTGSLFTSIGGSRYRATPDGTGGEAFFAAFISASRSSPIYGNSDTVQPPALTLLPCIKAFDAAVNPGLIDVTELAQEIAGKVDRVINGKNIAYIVDSYNDMKGNWWREWSDGWLEQGGLKRGNGVYAKVTVNLLRPFSGPDYTLTTGSTIGGDAWYTNTASTAGQAATSDLAGCFTDKTINSFNIQGFSTHLWYACGVKGD